MKDYRSITETLIRVEESFPVSTLTCEGLHVWPLLRTRLASGLFWEKAFDDPNYSLASYAAVERRLQANREAAGPLAQATTRLEGGLKALARSAGKAVGRPAALFMTMGYEYVRLRDGTYRNRFFDPVKPLLDEMGAAHADVECGFEGKRTDPKRFPTVKIDSMLAAASGVAQHKVKTGQAASIAAAEELFVHLRRMGLPAILDYADLLFTCARMAELSRFFRLLIEDVRPALTFVVCHYHETAMAFLHASRQAGVRSVEIQHSVIYDWDWNWTWFRNEPEEGCNTLPDVFWTWGERFTRLIQAGAAPDAKRLAPRNGGNVWLETWRREEGQAPNPEVEALRGAGKTILYTVPFGDERMFDELFPPFFLEAVERSPDSWRWILRFHYKSGPQLMRFFQERLAPLGAKVSVHHGDKHQLFDLFQIADRHLSQTSTTVVEAEAFGLPNVVIGKSGAEWYAKEIAEGRYAFADSAPGLLAALEAGREPDHPAERLIETDPGLARRLLRELLGEAARSPVSSHRAGPGPR